MSSQVYVYWNVIDKIWSIKRGNDAVEHASELVMRDVKFRVWEGGRQRTLRLKKKTVHAFAVGFISHEQVEDSLPMVRVTYNPFVAGHFVRCDSGERVDTTFLAKLLQNGTLLVAV